MNSAGLRSAQAAIDGARGAVDRLDETRHPEDNAADLIEGWNGAQAALLALAGVAAVSDNALIGEARKRGVLSLQDAHSLVAFSAAAERARDGAYQPNAGDLAAARAGFHLLEAALGRAPATAEPPTPPRETEPPEPPPPPREAGTPLGPIVRPPRPASGSLLARGVVIVAVLAIIAVAGYYVAQFRSRSGHLERGIAAYASGNRATAKTEFGAATSRDPKSALPHIYLGRIARDEGDPIAAARHLDSAVTREPNNALALREMGAHLLALGNLDLARRFYVRAVTKDPTDRTAQGYLACTLARLGRRDEAQRFLQRAGPGEWSGCVAAGAIPAGSVPPH